MATCANVVRVLGPDCWNAHVVFARVPDVACQERRRLGSNSVTSHVVVRRTNLPEVAKVVPSSRRAPEHDRSRDMDSNESEYQKHATQPHTGTAGDNQDWHAFFHVVT